MFRKFLLSMCMISVVFLSVGVWGCGKKAEEGKETQKQEQMAPAPDTGAVDTTAMDTTSDDTM
jgi:hypothetical protein